MSETGYAAINDAKLYYEITGDGPPLVLVHAGIADLRLWDEQVEAFAQHFKVVRYDQRGYGKSQPVPGSYSDVDDLRDLLDVLNIDSAYLVASSKGGVVALDFALAYPGRVRGMVAVGTYPDGFDVDVPPPAQWDALKQAEAAANWKPRYGWMARAGPPIRSIKPCEIKPMR